MSDDLALHPLVRQMIREGTRDKPLTLNWAPIERDAYDCLKLPDLSPLQIRARTQIITELLVAGNRSVSYSRNRNHYCALQRYYPETYSYRAIVPAVDQLDAWGLIEHDKRIPGGRGLQSRLRPSTDLLEQLANVQVIYKPMEIIILRDSAGNPIGYVDNRETRQMRKRMTAINEAIAAQRVGLGERIIREGDRLDNGGRAQMQMHRVFVRGSWDNCGRLVGSFWQNLPKPERSTLTINGHSTVEVDYAGMHIRLLYDMVGKLMPGDPYDIDGWPRGRVKVALLIAINARTHPMTRAEVLARYGIIDGPDLIVDLTKSSCVAPVRTDSGSPTSRGGMTIFSQCHVTIFKWWDHPRASSGVLHASH